MCMIAILTTGALMYTWGYNRGLRRAQRRAEQLLDRAREEYDHPHAPQSFLRRIK